MHSLIASIPEALIPKTASPAAGRPKNAMPDSERFGNLLHAQVAASMSAGSKLLTAPREGSVLLSKPEQRPENSAGEKSQVTEAAIRPSAERSSPVFRLDKETGEAADGNGGGLRPAGSATAARGKEANPGPAAEEDATAFISDRPILRAEPRTTKADPEIQSPAEPDRAPVSRTCVRNSASSRLEVRLPDAAGATKTVLVAPAQNASALQRGSSSGAARWSPDGSIVPSREVDPVAMVDQHHEAQEHSERPLNVGLVGISPQPETVQTGRLLEGSSTQPNRGNMTVGGEPTDPAPDAQACSSQAGPIDPLSRPGEKADNTSMAHDSPWPAVYGPGNEATFTFSLASSASQIGNPALQSHDGSAAHTCSPPTSEIGNTGKGLTGRENEAASSSERKSRGEWKPPMTMQPTHNAAASSSEKKRRGEWKLPVTMQPTQVVTNQPSAASSQPAAGAATLVQTNTTAIAGTPPKRDLLVKGDSGGAPGIPGSKSSKPPAVLQNRLQETASTETHSASETLPSSGFHDHGVSHPATNSSTRALNSSGTPISNSGSFPFKAGNQGLGPISSSLDPSATAGEAKAAPGKMAAVPVNTGGAFARLDSAAAAPQTITNTPQRLAVGVHSAGLGWVEIHAHNTQGLVSATLATGSPETRNAVSVQLPQIREYLNGEQIHVGELSSEVFSSPSGNRDGSSQHAPQEGVHRSLKNSEQEERRPSGPSGEGNPESLSYINVRV